MPHVPGHDSTISLYGLGAMPQMETDPLPLVGPSGGANDAASGGFDLFGMPDGRALMRIGLASSIAGAAMSVVTAINSAKIAKIQGRAQARSLEHQAFISSINARAAERNANAIMQQGRAAIAQSTAEAGQVKARQRVSAAARGVVVDQGSARDITDTTEMVKEVQRLAINRESVARAGAARMQGTNLRNQSMLANVGAGNLRRSANQISSATAGAAQFVSSTGGVLRDYAAYRSFIT